jgi:hypothetical protein
MQLGSFRLRQAIASVVTAFVATLIAFGLCELALRLWDGIPLRPINIFEYKASFVTREASAEYDPLLGWRQKANRADPSFNITGDHGIRMNSGAIKPLPRQAILAVGDSFTAGSDVAEHETYSAQLERILDYPVINGGVGGYGSDQMIMAAERFIPLLHPAVIVIGILDDDINRAGYSIYGGAPKPWFAVGRDGEPSTTIIQCPRQRRAIRTARHHGSPIPILRSGRWGG